MLAVNIANVDISILWQPPKVHLVTSRQFITYPPQILLLHKPKSIKSIGNYRYATKKNAKVKTLKPKL